eukprot:GDKJ01035633.1.p1 GENE.GDKJ01035633.1~~GDKJ01035633.1.p1  ORF type:complete len:667 (+),score=104.25 GDKJ01035633.1:166-2166(+)
MKRLVFSSFFTVSVANMCSISQNPCFFRDQCSEKEGIGSCACPRGYTGDGYLSGIGCIDIDECASGIHSCDPDERCTNTIGGYKCSCKSGFVWSSISSGCVDDNECTSGKHNCGAKKCINSIGSFICDCDDPTKVIDASGRCSLDKNECTFASGTYHRCEQLCIDVDGGYKCACKPGYAISPSDLYKCVDVNECLTGRHGCSPNGGVCTNTAGSYTCSCDGAAGYANLSVTEQFAQGKHSCGDVDECLLHAELSCFQEMLKMGSDSTSTCCTNLMPSEGRFKCEMATNVDQSEMISIPFVIGDLEFEVRNNINEGDASSFILNEEQILNLNHTNIQDKSLQLLNSTLLNSTHNNLNRSSIFDVLSNATKTSSSSVISTTSSLSNLNLTKSDDSVSQQIVTNYEYLYNLKRIFQQFRNCTSIMNNIEFLGFELSDFHFNASSMKEENKNLFEECRVFCMNESKCNYFTFFEHEKKCKTVSALGIINFNLDAQSGVVYDCLKTQPSTTTGVVSNNQESSKTSPQQQPSLSRRLRRLKEESTKFFSFFTTNDRKCQNAPASKLVTLLEARRKQKAWFATSTSSSSTTTSTTTRSADVLTPAVPVSSFSSTTTTTTKLFVDYSKMNSFNTTIPPEKVPVSTNTFFNDVLGATMTTFAGVGRAFYNFFTAW